MCEPITLGIATAVIGGVQTIAGYQTQQQQAAYQYEAAQAARDYQIQVQNRNYAIAKANADAEYAGQMRAYNASQQAYEDQIEQNRNAANRAYRYEQLRLKGEREKAATQAQDLWIKKMKKMGTTLAAGRTGQSISNLVSDAEREYGRDLSRLGTNLGYAADAYELEAERIALDQRSANAAAASRRMFQPVRSIVARPMDPLNPVRPMGPSATSLVLGLGQSAIAGGSAYLSTKAPAAGDTSGGNQTQTKPAGD